MIINPICDSCPSGDFKARFYSVIPKQKINAYGRLSNFYAFQIVDSNGNPLWNSMKKDWYFAGIQANVPKIGKYRHAKIYALPRMLSPSQFMNLEENSLIEEFPSMERLCELSHAHEIIYDIRVEYKELQTSTFSKITDVINPRTGEWESTDMPSRGKIMSDLNFMGDKKKTFEDLKKEYNEELEQKNADTKRDYDYSRFN